MFEASVASEKSTLVILSFVLINSKNSARVSPFFEIPETKGVPKITVPSRDVWSKPSNFSTVDASPET